MQLSVEIYGMEKKYTDLSRIKQPKRVDRTFHQSFHKLSDRRIFEESGRFECQMP
jgi:hypothetical protein